MERDFKYKRGFGALLRKPDFNQEVENLSWTFWNSNKLWRSLCQMILHLIESLKEKKPKDAKPSIENVISSCLFFYSQIKHFYK